MIALESAQTVIIYIYKKLEFVFLKTKNGSSVQKDLILKIELVN